MHLTNWFLFAVAAMVLFSISNTLLKIASNKYDLFATLVPFAPAFAVGIGAFVLVFLYLFHFQKALLSQELFFLLLGAAIVATIGVVAFLSSLQQGKVAIVTAILGFSTLLVAVITNQLLGVQFSLKEIAAMLLAVISLALLVF